MGVGETKVIMHLDDPWFEYARSNIKSYEGRCRNAKTAMIKIGDLIEFHNGDQNFTVIVEDVLPFPTFEVALSKLPISNVLPNDTCAEYTPQEAIDIYLKYASLEKQLETGVVMFKIKYVKKCSVCAKHKPRTIPLKDPTNENFCVCYSCMSHGYMTNLGWNRGE